MINHSTNKNTNPKNKTIKASIPFLLCSIKLAFFHLLTYKKPLVVIMAKGFIFILCSL